MSLRVHGIFDALVEREEPRPVALQVGRHGDLLVADSEMHQTPLESEQRFPRIPIRPILLLRIRHRLTGEAVLQLHRHQRYPIEEQGQIQRFLVLF